MKSTDWDRVSITSEEGDLENDIAHTGADFPPSWRSQSDRARRSRWFELSSSRSKWAAFAAGLLLLLAIAGWVAPSTRTITSPKPSNPSVRYVPDLRGANNTEKTVVLYAYYETELSRPNAEFFIQHALHDQADFIFIVNGEAELAFPSDLPNVQVIRRPNTCYDLGSHGEVLEANDRALVKKYDKFILMNASVRGPFMPHWSRECWSSAFTSLVTNTVKLVGLTMNCIEGATEVEWLGIKVGDPSVVNLRHLQAMMLATDKTGLELLLVPDGLSACHSEYIDAIDNEIRLSSLIRMGGYELDAVMSLFQEEDDFAEACTAPNPFDEYPGFLHPHELVWVKSRAGTPPDVIDKYTHLARNYDSRNFCRAW